ncbi:unnamed protein product, partial [Laminaria digitata]
PRELRGPRRKLRRRRNHLRRSPRRRQPFPRPHLRSRVARPRRGQPRRSLGQRWSHGHLARRWWRRRRGGRGGSGGGGRGRGAGGGGLGDVLTAKLARTAIGHDAEGRLILLQTTGAATGADQDTSIPDGLDLSELADVLVEAGAVNAVNLVGGAPAALSVNGSAVIGPAGACSDIADSGSNGRSGFVEGSILPRCERPVSSLVCVHPKPPPLLEGAGAGTGGDSSSSSTGSSNSSSGSGFPTSADGGGRGVSSNAEGDDWDDGWGDNDGGGGEEEARLQWTEELCANNGTGTAAGLWEYLDDVEESALRYK